MVKSIHLNIIISILLILFLGSSCSIKKENILTKPQLNNGKKWRVGYLEGGPFVGYPMTLKALFQALSDLGWVEKIQLPAQQDEAATQALWDWMAHNAKSRYIEFVADAYWSDHWDNVYLRPHTKREIIKRLNGTEDIDLMIAMGTWAGQDLSTDEHSVPTVVMTASNPVLSGIIKSAAESGRAHVHARVDPTRYERQIRQFHDIFKFNRLGVVFDQSTAASRNYAAIGKIQKVASERGFAIVSCDASASHKSNEDAEQELLECYHELAPRVDAVYITAHRGATLRNMPKILAPFNKKKCPSYSQSGSLAVRKGVLMGSTEGDLQSVGSFYAKTIAKIFNGATPGALPQVWEDPLRLAINMQTAKLIEYIPSEHVMEATDEIYE